MNKKIFALFFCVALILISSFISAWFWQDITGMASFSLSKIFKTQQSNVQSGKITDAGCKIDSKGKCFTAIASQRLNPTLQKNAKLQTLQFNQQKTISGKQIKISKTEKESTRIVLEGAKTKRVNVPVVNLCISGRCQDYGIDQTVDINGVIYDLAVVRNEIKLFPRGAPLVPPHNERWIEFEQTDYFPSEPISIEAAVPELIPVPITAPRIFKAGFIIDRDTVPHPQATRAEIEELIRIANEKFSARTNIRFVLHGVQEVNMGGYDTYGAWGINADGTSQILQSADDYYNAHMDAPPNGIIIFREDPTASSYGGYATLSSNLQGFGFCNNFAAPITGDSFIYVGVLDWDHMNSMCGYDDNAHENRISDVSIASELGIQCGRPGVPCRFFSDLNYYVCNLTDTERWVFRNRLNSRAKAMVHEFLHSFHPSPVASNSFHGPCSSTSGDCPENFVDSLTGFSCDARGSDMLELGDSYARMCPITWKMFADSWHSCGNIAYSENCEPAIDRCMEGTFCEAWSAGNYRCSCLNNRACEDGNVCIEGRCKIRFGGKCDTRRADLCRNGNCVLLTGERFKGTCKCTRNADCSDSEKCNLTSGNCVALTITPASEVPISGLRSSPIR